MIDQGKIDTIKNTIDLKALVESKGIKLKKNGKGWFGLCPFHNDKNPSLSVTPSKNQWHCFGCDKGGDVIRFVELIDNVDFKEAIKRLDSNGYKKISVKSKPPKKPESLTVKDKKLLARVVSYYQHALNEDSQGINYLKANRNITDNQSIKDFGTGYANGTLLKILPDDEEVIKSLKKIGILNKNGKELFLNCVVFPLYSANGSIVSLYGRNIDDDQEINHLYLPGVRSGLVNRQAVKRSQSIILTESIIDALTLYDQGFKNVVPVYGVNGLIDDHIFLFNRKIKEIYLAFDADESGKKAAQTV